MKYPLYFDYNATTPCDPQVIEAMLPYFGTHFGNAASKSHAYGWVADEAVEIAREQVASLIGAEKESVYFTSGATESINLAIRGIGEAYTSKGNHIITCATEHKAVLDVCGYLQKKGTEITLLPVNEVGLPDLEILRKAIRPSTILIAVMYANNETGMIMPVREIGAIAKEHQIPFFCDASQAAGKIPVDVASDGISVMAFSGHKLYGPKGTGVLYASRKNPRIKITPLQYGGGHEKGMRSGTLNVPGIAGIGLACELCHRFLETEKRRVKQLRNFFLAEVLKMDGVVLNGDSSQLLPHVANLRFKGTGSNAMLQLLSRDIAVASGSACTSASTEPSHVLKAMGMTNEGAGESIRFSLGRFTTEEEVKQAIYHIQDALQKLKQ